MTASPYSVLELRPEATAREIKDAHRRLARKYHPDKSQAPDAHEKFLLVQEAFEFLKQAPNRQAFQIDPGIWNENLNELKRRRTQLKRRKNRLKSLFE